MAGRDAEGNVETYFCSRGGLSDLPALQSIHLTAATGHLPAILEPLSASKHLRSITIQASPYMLPSGYHRDAVAQSILTLARARTSLTLTFLCQMDTCPWPPIPGSEDLTLEEMRDQLLSMLAELREEGRLRFVRYKGVRRQTAMRDTNEIEEF
ncbi:hypothetical protein FOMPIDRAFT_152073 [Fomitopsis schrenkii]|uniref:Uncharacterized protein n=1 Tax=Fomitopsis schrenkii TaxID=2126942 RepID=S8FU78_FOMSC|nr:hypothetical protein FOMPIDRAFT_152073 [Fomitopsis schrenkii]